MRQLKIHKIWRKALAVAVPKPNKPLWDPKRYRLISLLCVPFKVLERIIGRLRSCLHKWGMIPSAACECGTEEQTVGHVVLHCPIH